jgi:hypothetical protein
VSRMNSCNAWPASDFSFIGVNSEMKSFAHLFPSMDT